MKRILFLITKTQPIHEPLFFEAANKLNLNLFIAKYDQLIVEFFKNSPKLLINGEKLENFDLVFFRTIGKYLEEEMLISDYCSKNRIPVVDSILKHSKPWIDRKSFEYQSLAFSKIPIIDSYFVSEKSFPNIENNLKYPVIAKITNGSKGEGVYKCESKKSIIDAFKKQNQPLMIQEYIENSGDIRVFIIGEQVIGAIKRIKTSEKEFRNNVSLGGRAETYKLNEKEKSIALGAAKTLGYQITGVDLVIDKNNNIKVMEVNRAPQFNGFMKTTKIDIPYKILEYLKLKAN